MSDLETIGIAIEIPDPHGRFLQSRRQSYGDQLANSIPSHITLVPPLQVTAEGLKHTVDVISQLVTRARAFHIGLQGTESFRPVSPVVYIAVAEGSVHIKKLADDIREALALPEPEFPFHPHVTVAHHLDDAALDHAMDDLSGFRCGFEASFVNVYVHEDGRGWVTRDELTLQAALG